MNACSAGFARETMAKRKNGSGWAMDGIRYLTICKQQHEINCLHSEIGHIVPNRSKRQMDVMALGPPGTLCMVCSNQMEHENNERNYLITWLTYVCIVMWFTVNHHVRLRFSI